MFQVGDKVFVVDGYYGAFPVVRLGTVKEVLHGGTEYFVRFPGRFAVRGFIIALAEEVFTETKLGQAKMLCIKKAKVLHDGLQRDAERLLEHIEDLEASL
jgi:hypothetical protein